ncbi:sulfite exporter TauE/SafE family protein [Limimaricola pyoseonensis]|uniref:Probable membrane transporter protein n=1 Tax=Limimaricola pyoseonensis TaxID=521013 RepID=A0A1G6ZYI5_9RHOB|nr:sulfite exporter TauE/SafE family protein [Limimaricola pyoseonensis]SDE07619.1 hypothetical protein SAMN04488567_0735 [Limimaricola pyoseonensis]
MLELAMIAGGAAAGGFVNGLAGFGTALFALGFFLQIMPPVQAVSIVVVLSVAAGLPGIWVVRNTMMAHRGRLMRFLLPALFGIPLGIMALSYLEPRALKLVIGGFLLLYGGYFSLRRTLPNIERATPITDTMIGFSGGLLGGAASLSGALPTMWCSMRDWPKAETRAVLQPFNVVVLGLSALLFAQRGAYTAESLYYIAVALPATLLFARLGIHVFHRLRDDQFRRLLIGLTFVSGAVLLLREAVALV